MYARAATFSPLPTSILKSCVDPVKGGAFLPSLVMTIFTAAEIDGASLATAGIVFSMGMGLIVA